MIQQARENDYLIDATKERKNRAIIVPDSGQMEWGNY